MLADNMLRGKLSRRARERLAEATSRRVLEGVGDSVIDSYYCISLHLGCLKQGEHGGYVSLKCRMGEHFYILNVCKLICLRGFLPG